MTDAEGAPVGDSRLLAAVKWAAIRLPKILALGVVLVVVVLTFTIIRPHEPADAGVADMAEAWSDSIRKLGIEPLFPPQEDFNVGDIWAVIATFDQASGQTREVNPRESIVGKGVRIGHIALADLGYHGVTRPVFPPTVVKDEQLVFEKIARFAVPVPTSDGAVELSLVSFPNLSIVRSDNNSGTIASFFGLGAARHSNSTETVKIPFAETYSVAATNAAVALGRWCGAPENEGMCDDGTIRKLIAYSLLNRVFDTLEGKYRYRFDIKLVTQTYMTRQMDFQRLGDEKLDRHVKAGGKQEDGAAKAETDAFVSDQKDAFGFGIEHVTYPRPVVFGFRAVSMSLEPSKPPTPTSVVTPAQQ